MKLFIGAIILASIASIAHGQFSYVSVEDGAIAIAGSWDNLTAIEAFSEGGFLSLDTVDFPNGGTLPKTDPFPSNSAVIAVDTPEHIVLGVLGAAQRIEIEGKTRTSIQYDGPKAFDLRVNLGIGDRVVPLCITGCPEPTAGTLIAFGILGLVGIRKRRSHAVCLVLPRKSCQHIHR